MAAKVKGKKIKVNETWFSQTCAVKNISRINPAEKRDLKIKVNETI